MIETLEFWMPDLFFACSFRLVPMAPGTANIGDNRHIGEYF